MAAGAMSLIGGGMKMFGGSKGSSGGGGNNINVQAAQPALCGNASVLTDSHSGVSDMPESVVQGNLGSSFGASVPSGSLPTTYADGGTAGESDSGNGVSLNDTIHKYQKMFCTDGLNTNFIKDDPELLHYQHTAPAGGLSTIHHGFSNGYDDGGKVTPTPKAATFVPHSSFLDVVGHAILPSVFKAGDQMQNALTSPADQADKQSSDQKQQQQKNADQDQQKPVKEFHFEDGGLSQAYKDASPEGHHPEFITGKTGYYACGKGTGQSDDIPAMLHDGDFVCDADMVSALGDGSSKAGKDVLDGFRTRIPHESKGGSTKPVPAKIADGEYVLPEAFVTAIGSGDNAKGAEILNGLREKLRKHKRAAPDNKIPPKAKDPMDYINKESK